MQVKINGEEIQAALQKLVDAYPGGRCDIWAQANDGRGVIDYVAFVYHEGQSENVTADTPMIAADRVIAEFPRKDKKQHLLDQIANLNSKLAELEAAQPAL